MTIGLISGAIALAAWLLIEHFKTKHEEKEMEEIVNNDSSEQETAVQQAVSDKDIIIKALRNLQCEPEIDTYDDSVSIVFEYQAEQFSIRIPNDNKFMILYDTFWYRFDANDIEQLSEMKKAINNINWNSQVNVCYNKLSSDNLINLHTMTYFVCSDEEYTTNYLRCILRECFIVHNSFFKMMAEKKIE